MIGIGAAAMGNAIAVDLAVLQVDDVKARVARRKREIDDADRVARPDLMNVERGFRLGEQGRVNACRR